MYINSTNMLSLSDSLYLFVLSVYARIFKKRKPKNKLGRTHRNLINDFNMCEFRSLETREFIQVYNITCHIFLSKM